MLDREDLDLLKNILSLHNDNINYDLLYNVLTATKDFEESKADILDSFSSNQFKAKVTLLEHVEKLNVLTKEDDLVIFGSWYGSILIPKLADKVKRITCIDLDEKVLKIAKNRLFKDYENIEYRVGDIFADDLKRYKETKLFINASCEHMKPMKEFKWFEPNSYFAFTSNDMDYIEGHINCVHSLDEFKSQLPENSEVLFEEEVEDTRGIRYMLVGNFL